MKNLTTILAVFVLMVLIPLAANAGDLQVYEKMVENLDAKQAMAYANQWKWSQNDITSYVNSKEVVFEFPNNKIKRIALPEDKMVVAVAPYINYTHG